MAKTVAKIDDWYAGNLRFLVFDVIDLDHGDMPLDLTAKVAKWTLAPADGGSYATDPVLEKKSPSSGISMAPTRVASAVVAAGGTGYVVGDELLVLGGAGDPAYVTVATLGGGGAVASVVVSSGGTYSVDPTNPATTSGGTGLGCTLTLTLAYYSGRLIVTIPSADTTTFLGDFHQELELFDFSNEATVVAVGEVEILANVVNT